MSCTGLVVYPPAVAVAVTVTMAPSDKTGLNDPDVVTLKVPILLGVIGNKPVIVVGGGLGFVMTIV